MKVTAISDLHGDLIKIESCNILCICGDIFPLEIQKDYIKAAKWFFNDFLNWIKELPCEYVALTPGNHDFWFFYNFIDESLLTFNNKLFILINDECTLNGLRIYGTPWCKKFGNWAYMPKFNDVLVDIYDKIPINLDILLCHDSPDICNIGVIHEGKYNGENVGNDKLTYAIHCKKPKYVFCGHIHSGNHNLSDFGTTKIANVSIKDENYEVKYKPLTIEINMSKKEAFFNQVRNNESLDTVDFLGCNIDDTVDFEGVTFNDTNELI